MLVVYIVFFIMALIIGAVLDQCDDIKKAKSKLWTGVLIVTFLVSFVSEGVALVILLAFSGGYLFLWAFSNKRR